MKLQRQHILIISSVIALGMIGGALYVRFKPATDTSASSSSTAPASSDNAAKITQPPVSETPVTRPTPTPTNNQAP